MNDTTQSLQITHTKEVLAFERPKSHKLPKNRNRFMSQKVESLSELMHDSKPRAPTTPVIRLLFISINADVIF